MNDVEDVPSLIVRTYVSPFVVAAIDDDKSLPLNSTSLATARLVRHLHHTANDQQRLSLHLRQILHQLMYHRHLQRMLLCLRQQNRSCRQH